MQILHRIVSISLAGSRTNGPADRVPDRLLNCSQKNNFSSTVFFLLTSSPPFLLCRPSYRQERGSWLLPLLESQHVLNELPACSPSDFLCNLSRPTIRRRCSRYVLSLPFVRVCPGILFSSDIYINYRSIFNNKLAAGVIVGVGENGEGGVKGVQ